MYTGIMGKKLKKRRAKQYRPAEERPSIHRYSAETEEKSARVKKVKRKTILIIIAALPLLLLAWLLL